MTGCCVVLMFHRVLDTRDISPWNQDLAMSAARFEAILRALSRQSVPSPLYGEWIPAGPSTQAPAFAVTLDDGWRDNYTMPGRS